MAISTSPSAFFEAVRQDDVTTVRRLLVANPHLALARWPGRAGDGKMRSLGPAPFNQHTWHKVPADHAPDDPRWTSTPLIYSRHDGIVRLLVEAGADVNAKGTSGELEMPDWFFTPLWRAAHDGRMASVRLLVEKGADLQFTNPDGSNQALKTAAENDHEVTCDFLLSRGARPDLITAAMLGLAERVEAWLGADPKSIDARDSHGRSALDAATLLDSFRRARRGLRPEHDRAAHLLIQHGAKMEAAHAAGLGLLPELQRMIQQDPDLFRRPQTAPALIGGTALKESPLQAAQRRGHEKVVAFLLPHGAGDAPPIILT